jgi:hypothetical protein
MGVIVFCGNSIGKAPPGAYWFKNFIIQLFELIPLLFEHTRLREHLGY